MNEAILIRLYKIAKSFARRKGYKHDAEDFAGWYAGLLLEGKSKHQIIGKAFIDYLRAKYGHKKSNGQKRFNEKFKVSIISSRDYDDSYMVGEDELEGFDLAKSHDVLSNRVLNLLTSTERAYIWLMYVWGYSACEISECFGISEGRVSQRMKEIHKKLEEKLNVK